MSTATENPQKSEKVLTTLEVFAWVCAVVAFSPAIVWLAGALSKSPQLRDAVVILVTAILVMAVEYKIRPHRPRLTADSAKWLLGSYAALIASNFLGLFGGFLALAGLSGAIVAAGLACFDRRRYVYAAGGAFYAFTLMSFLIGAFDFPLRVLAGRMAVWILSFFNSSVSLVTFPNASPQIGIMAGGSSFLVATECNGFGIISACVVLATASVIFRKNIGILRRIAIVLLCAVFAYAANSLRIAAIISAAEIAGKENYGLMHEAFGYVFFALALVCVWTASRKF